MSYPGNFQYGSSDPEKYKQIDSLKQYFPTVKEVTKDGLYEIPVTLPSRKLINLRISLTKDFPRIPPAIQIFPPVQHRLVDQQMFIIPSAHESLTRWTGQSNLGKTVFEVIQKLMQDPPQILPSNPNPGLATTPNQPLITPTPVPSNNPPPGYGTNYNQQSVIPPKQPPPSYPNQPVNKPVTHTGVPPVPSNFPELESKTPSELSQLLNDETEFNKFFEELHQVQNMKKLRDDLRTTNEEVAKKNLSKEAEIEKLRREVQSKLQSINEKRSQFEQKAARQQEVMKQFSTPALIEKLAFAAHQAEADSDALANRFLSGEMDYKDFIKEFMEKRKLYHLRAAKKESLMMLTR